MLNSIVVRKTQSETTVRCYHTPVRGANAKRRIGTIPAAGEEEGELEVSPTAGEKRKGYDWENTLEVSHHAHHSTQPS